MLKVFLDSSVLVAATGSQTGGSFKIVTSIGQGKLEGWINDGVVAESEEAVRRKFSKENYKLFISWLEKDYFRILPFPEESRLQKLNQIDTKDRHIIISAQESKVDFLISLDRHHILTQEAQKSVPKTKILTSGDFLQKHFR